ncbi:guanylate-binding protein 1-like [Crotalus adamanteus]|uniref:Guanylate-binding protein 1-like n=1 Tax=Crotalus adamanteus TaxID=8729 RepID=A0AAW1AY32_CROAD
MEAPVCLVENRPDGLRVSPEALRLLSDIWNPVVVVSIVGLYRTGKSYLMNRLAGKTPGFSLGSTVQAKTKGIWMWCLPYPERPHQTLVLLDTEGLGDIQKGNPQTDAWIFALAVLLSSTLVYNSVGTIDQTALDKLHFVTELSEHIKAKASSAPGDASEFVRFFPTFVWTLRDFTMQLEWDGQPITEDEYLEHALALKKGNTKENEILNLPHKCIRLFFPKRKCFVFECPTKRKKLPHLEQMEDSELEPEFVEPANLFCRYVFQTSQEKTLPGGHVVTGDLLAKLVKVELAKTLESKKKEYCSKNELKSSEFCSALLNSLSENLEKNFKNGSYSRADGHQEFLNDLENVEKLFLETPKKGIMAGKFLREFLQGKEAIGKTILKSDLSLQKKEKEIEDEKMKAKARELEQKVQKQEMEMFKEKLEDQKHSYEMNLQKLKEKMVEERNQLKAENEKMMENKLKEQQAFLKEGFEQEVSQLKEEIQQLKKENEAVEEPHWISSALETLGKALTDAMPIILDKAVAAVSKSIKPF